MTIHLNYNQEFDRWSLRDQKMNDDLDTNYELLIKTSWQGKEDGWFDYRFFVWHAGEWFECVTRKDYEQRVQDIVDNEGKEVADLWETYQNHYEVVRDNHPVFALRRKWEAMMELELFFPAITLRQWPSKKLPKEYWDKVGAARDKWQQEEAAAMAAEGAIEKAERTDFEKQDIESRELRNDAWATRMGFTD